MPRSKEKIVAIGSVLALLLQLGLPSLFPVSASSSPERARQTTAQEKETGVEYFFSLDELVDWIFASFEQKAAEWTVVHKSNQSSENIIPQIDITLPDGKAYEIEILPKPMAYDTGALSIFFRNSNSAFVLTPQELTEGKEEFKTQLREELEEISDGLSLGTDSLIIDNEILFVDRNARLTAENPNDWTDSSIRVPGLYGQSWYAIQRIDGERYAITKTTTIFYENGTAHPTIFREQSSVGKTKMTPVYRTFGYQDGNQQIAIQNSEQLQQFEELAQRTK